MTQENERKKDKDLMQYIDKLERMILAALDELPNNPHGAIRLLNLNKRCATVEPGERPKEVGRQTEALDLDAIEAARAKYHHKLAFADIVTWDRYLAWCIAEVRRLREEAQHWKASAWRQWRRIAEENADEAREWRERAEKWATMCLTNGSPPTRTSHERISVSTKETAGYGNFDAFRAVWRLSDADVLIARLRFDVYLLKDDLYDVIHCHDPDRHVARMLVEEMDRPHYRDDLWEQMVMGGFTVGHCGDCVTTPATCPLCFAMRFFGVEYDKRLKRDIKMRAYVE